MGLNDLYEFDLVPVADGSINSQEKWTHIQHLLLHMQPANSVSPLVGDPPRAIRLLGYGGTEMASGLLQKVSELAGSALRIVPG